MPPVDALAIDTCILCPVKSDILCGFYIGAISVKNTRGKAGAYHKMRYGFKIIKPITQGSAHTNGCNKNWVCQSHLILVTASTLGQTVELAQDDDGHPEFVGSHGRQTAELGQVIDEAVGVRNQDFRTNFEKNRNVFGQNFVSNSSRFLLRFLPQLQLLLPVLQPSDVVEVFANAGRRCRRRVGLFGNFSGVVVVVAVRLVEDVLALVDESADLLSVGVAVLDEAEVSVLLRRPPEDRRLVALQELDAEVDGVQTTNILKNDGTLEELDEYITFSKWKLIDD